MTARLKESSSTATARADGECLIVQYEPAAGGYGYVRPEVIVEFGARSTGEPADVHRVTCDASDYIEGVAFPNASPRVMRAERTFWEKATAIHVYCRQGRLRSERFARHWYDIARLDAASYATKALQDRELGLAVARHKSCFFSEKDSEGVPIDYSAAVSGALQLVPSGPALDALAADYERMSEDGVLLDDPEPFKAIVKQCAELQARANAVR